MTGRELARHRKEKKRTQVWTARALGVSQAYLSLLEAEKRPLTELLKKKAAKFFDLSPTELPTHLAPGKLGSVTDTALASDLADLGYTGFSHLKRKRARRKNPAEVLLEALNAPKRDARVVEALPWLLLTYPDLKWNEVLPAAKMYDLQNRLGYVISVARRLAELKGLSEIASTLKKHEVDLERSLLAREDTLCNETMTGTERNWLTRNRSEDARRWHLLTDLSPQSLSYV